MVKYLRFSVSTLIRLTAWSFLALISFWPGLVAAQGESPGVENLVIELWPEFDRPGVLVIYSGQLASTGDGEIPQVGLTLPESVELNAVAYQDPTNGNLLLAEHETEAADGQTLLTMSPEADNFWVEFYVPAEVIAQEGEQRSFSYAWQGDLPVAQLTWQVQQPATASGLTVEPGGGQMGTDELGLPAYSVAAGAVPAGETATASVSYQKADDVLSISVIQANEEAQQPAPAPASTQPRRNLALPIGIAVGGVALLAGGIFLYSRSGQDDEEPVRARRARRAPQHEHEQAGYCTNCGNALQAGDKFCRECGAPVRP